jgi:hypothetical protein
MEGVFFSLTNGLSGKVRRKDFTLGEMVVRLLFPHPERGDKPCGDLGVSHNDFKFEPERIYNRGYALILGELGKVLRDRWAIIDGTEEIVKSALKFS